MEALIMSLRIGLITIILQYSDETIIVSQFESCENSTIMFFVNIKKIDDSHQVFNANYSSSIPMGDNLKLAVTLTTQISIPTTKLSSSLEEYSEKKASFVYFDAVGVSEINAAKAIIKGNLLVGNNWLPLFTWTEEEGLCTMLERRIGPLFHEILQAVAIMPRCPVPRGNYMLKNYKPSLEKLRFQFPPGRVKLHIEGLEKGSGKLKVCANIVVQNK